MALFAKNPNETVYFGGKKHWADVIKNSGPAQCLVWRQPEEDFNTKSTLIVMPGEQALFIKGGSIEQIFENGTYKLSTENYPFISRLRNTLTGGISVFNCVVYFVRTAHTQEILWGTATPIQARDKVWGVRTSLRARGSYKVHVENPSVFLEKLIGNNVAFETEEGLNRYFINEFQSKIRSVISKEVNSLDTELIGLDAKLDEFSEVLEPAVNEILEEYGMQCKDFSVSALDIDTSMYDRIDQAQVEAVRKAKFAQGDASAMNILGDNWDKLQAVNLMDKFVTNPNVGELGTAGAGMEMGMLAGSMLGGMAGKIFGSFGGQESGMTAEVPAAVQENRTEDPAKTLGKLKKLLDAGLIEKEEYDAKKKEILDRM